MFRYMSIIAILGYSLAAHAAPVAELERYLDQEIGRMDDAVASASSAELNGTDQSQNTEAWFLRSFFLRVRGKAGFEIPGIAKIEIIPEAEMLWQRPLPDGWASYKPKP